MFSNKPAHTGARQRLSVSIVTLNSEGRLASIIAETRCYADEVVVGVDAASTDRTFEIASELADVVYRFRLPMPGQLAPARLLALEHVTGDWILSLDDDESMEESFDRILPELMSRAEVTHYFFPRKCIINLDPCEYLREPPWFPDWQLRLFRNDNTIIWKPARPHTGYWVQGLGNFESRSSILHFEPLLCTNEKRKKKIEAYRRAGTQHIADELDRFTGKLPPCRATLRPAAKSTERSTTLQLHPDIRDLCVSHLPPWKAAILIASMPQAVRPGSPVVAEVHVRNTGKLSWWPPVGNRFPPVNLSFHLTSSQGEMLQFDCERHAMPEVVRPGQEVQFLVEFLAPAKSGDYILEWDLVGEGLCWFAQCGSTVVRSVLTVFE